MRTEQQVQDGSREMYEAACLAAGVEPMSDKDVCGYAMTYGDPSRLAPTVARDQRLSAARRARLVQEQAVATSAWLAEHEARHGSYDPDDMGAGCDPSRCRGCSDCR